MPEGLFDRVDAVVPFLIAVFTSTGLPSSGENSALKQTFSYGLAYLPRCFDRGYAFFLRTFEGTLQPFLYS